MGNISRAREILKTSAAIDGYQGSPLNEDYLTLLKQSGITAYFTSVSDSHTSLRDTMQNIGSLKEFVAEHEADVVLCRTADDIRSAKESERIGIFLSFQDTHCLGLDIGLMDLFYELGVRMVQLTANDANMIGDGCGEPRQAGLTRLGKRLVKKLNELGVLIDLSHVGDRSREDAIDTSEGPCIVSHGNAMGFCSNPRNVSDSVIKKLVSRGGMIGATTYPSLCTWEPRPTMGDFIDNVDYLANLVGVDAVGLGLAQVEGVNLDAYLSQYPALYGPTCWPSGTESITAWPEIVDCLLDRGYSEASVRKIIGENWFSMIKLVVG